MRRRRAVATAVLLVVTAGFLGACGDDDPDVSAGSPGDSPASTTTTLDPDDAVTSPPIDPGVTSPPGRPQRVEPTNDAENVRPMNFEVGEVKAAPGGVLVRFWGGIAPCFVLDHYTVTETAETVTIGLFAGNEPTDEDVACIEIALRYEVKVPLDAPLGARTVVDANA
jgi:hypothetical protein